MWVHILYLQFQNLIISENIFKNNFYAKTHLTKKNLICTESQFLYLCLQQAQVSFLFADILLHFL